MKKKSTHGISMAFDNAHGDARITMSPEEVNARMDAALAHPDSEIVLVVFTFQNELFLKFNGPPSQGMQEVLEQAARVCKKAREVQ